MSCSKILQGRRVIVMKFGIDGPADRANNRSTSDREEVSVDGTFTALEMVGFHLRNPRAARFRGPSQIETSETELNDHVTKSQIPGEPL